MNSLKSVGTQIEPFGVANAFRGEIHMLFIQVFGKYLADRVQKMFFTFESGNIF